MNSKGRNKRGLLFTVGTFLMLLGLLSFSIFYLGVRQDAQGRIYSLDGTRMRARYSDMLESWMDLMNISFYSIERTGDTINVTVNSNYLVASGQNYSPNIISYEGFLEDSLASMTNVEFELDLSPDLSISPWNTTIEPQGDELHIYTGNISALQGIDIAIQTSKSNYTSVSTPPSDGGDNPTISVRIVAGNGSIIMDSTPRLDPAGSATFQVGFNDSSTIDVVFSSHNGDDGTLRVLTSGLTGNVYSLSLYYGATEAAAIEPGNYSLKMREIEIRNMGEQFVPRIWTAFELLYEDCEEISEWSFDPESGNVWEVEGSEGSMECHAESCVSPGDYIISASMNMSGMEYANISFDWEYQNLNMVDECLSLEANDGSGWVTGVFVRCPATPDPVAGSSASGSEMINLSEHINMTEAVQLRFHCINSDQSDDEYLDNINITAYGWL